MDIINVLHRFMELEEKNTIIKDIDGNILYKSKIMDIPLDIVLEKLKSVEYDFEKQDFCDKRNGFNFTIKRKIIEKENKKFYCYKIEDINEYLMLVREVSLYSKSVSRISKFQTYIMNNLSMPYDAFLPGLKECFDSDEAVMLSETDGGLVISRYKDELVRKNIKNKNEYLKYFKLREGENCDGAYCLMNTVIQGNKYVILVGKDEENGKIALIDLSINSIVSLFIENSILRDKILFESEHDKLTGLYNKRKYFSLRKTNFSDTSSMAVFNFDVNNLKHINDNYGHEYGDKLIVMAAESIKAVLSENVLGFRMGGDEFVVTALNITEEETENILKEWKASLDKLNDMNDHMFCSMACGMAFGNGSSDHDELYEKADKLMYENKKKLKENNNISYMKTEKQTS